MVLTPSTNISPRIQRLSLGCKWKQQTWSVGSPQCARCGPQSPLRACCIPRCGSRAKTSKPAAKVIGWYNKSEQQQGTQNTALLAACLNRSLSLNSVSFDSYARIATFHSTKRFTLPPQEQTGRRRRKHSEGDKVEAKGTERSNKTIKSTKAPLSSRDNQNLNARRTMKRFRNCRSAPQSQTKKSKLLDSSYRASPNPRPVPTRQFCRLQKIIIAVGEDPSRSYVCEEEHTRPTVPLRKNISLPL